MIDVVVFFFLLGIVARLVKSDLRLPEALYETLSIYLLLAIGLKGGIELSRQPLAVLAPQVGACLALGLAERDGLAVIVGYVLAAASVAVLAAVSSALYAGVMAFFQALFGV